MIGFLLTFSLYVSTVFLVLISIFGISYTGSEDSPLYIMTVLGVNTLAVGYVLFQELFHSRLAKGSVLPYFIPLVVVLAYLAELAFGDIFDVSETSKIIQSFFAYSVPGIVIGTYCYRYDKIYLIVRNLELLAILCTVGLIVSLPSMYADEHFASIGGGGTHQTISYVAAICSGIFFICGNIRNPDPRFRYKLFDTWWFRKIAIMLLIVNVVICIVGGGRGGAVLLVINIVVCLYYFSRKNFWKILALVGIGITIFYYISTNISLWGIDTMFQTGFERAFSFIGSGDIDMSETSGRDYVYWQTLQLIESEPLLGYGIFHQYDLCRLNLDQPYCHNILFEMILQRGIFYLLIWLIGFIFLFRKIHRLILQGSYYLIVICSYPFIMLMFSGTYLVMPLFWFVIVYVGGSVVRKTAPVGFKAKHIARLVR